MCSKISIFANRCQAVIDQNENIRVSRYIWAYTDIFYKLMMADETILSKLLLIFLHIGYGLFSISNYTENNAAQDQCGSQNKGQANGFM